MNKCALPFQCSSACSSCIESNDCVDLITGIHTYCIEQNGKRALYETCHYGLAGRCVCSKSSLYPEEQECYCLSGDSVSVTLVEPGDFCGYNLMLENGEVVEECSSLSTGICVCGEIICEASSCVSGACGCKTAEDCYGSEFGHLKCEYGQCVYGIEFCPLSALIEQVHQLVCMYCDSGYYVVNAGRQCVPCNEAVHHCKECQIGMFSTTCVECEPGYAVSDGYCIPCLEGCMQCEKSEQCLEDSCELGYYLDAYFKCEKCSIIMQGCTECQNITFPACLRINGQIITDSSKCADGTYAEVFENGYKCTKCEPQCKTCVSEEQCIVPVGDGYYQNELGQAVPCALGCSTCISANVCTSCAPGYTIFSFGDFAECLSCQYVVSKCTRCNKNTCFEIEHTPIIFPHECPYGSLFSEFACVPSDKACKHECGVTCDSCLVDGDCTIEQYCVFEGGKKEKLDLVCEQNAYEVALEMCWCVNGDALTNVLPGGICDPGIYMYKGAALNSCLYGAQNCVTSEGIACKKYGTVDACTCYDNSDCYANQVCARSECVYMVKNCVETQIVDYKMVCMRCTEQYELVDGACVNCQLDFFPSCSACVSGVGCTAFESCPTGFYLNGQLCEPCYEGCSLCTANRCTACKIGYYLSTYECISCAHTPILGCEECELVLGQLICTKQDGNPGELCGTPGTYFDVSDQKCKECSPYCLKCDSFEVCTECQLSYQLTDLFDMLMCMPICSDNCELCINSVCLKCMDGFYEDGNQCFPCYYVMSNCAVCDSSTCYQLTDQLLLPTSCEGGLYYKDGACHSCPSGCAYCEYTDRLTCYGCMSQYYESMGICKSCSNVINGCVECFEELNQPMCLDQFISCPEGSIEYYSNTVNMAGCVTCGTSCAECIIEHAVVRCVVCKPGYFPLNDTCESCQLLYPGCTRCEQTQCLEEAGNEIFTCPLGFEFDPELKSCYTCQRLFSVCVSCENDNICIEQTTIYGTSGFKARECPNGFANYKSACVRCIENCVVCEQPFSCLKCKPYYYLDGLTCKSCKELYDDCSECQEDACFANNMFAPTAPEDCPTDLYYFYNPDYNGRPACQLDIPCSINEVWSGVCSCVNYQDTEPGKICIQRPAGLVSIRLCQRGTSNNGSLCACRSEQDGHIVLISNGEFCDEDGNALLTTCELGVFLEDECICSNQPCKDSYCQRDRKTQLPMCKPDCTRYSTDGDCFCGDFYIESGSMCLAFNIYECEKNTILRFSCVCNLDSALQSIETAADCGRRPNQFCRAGVCYNSEDFVDDCMYAANCQTTTELCLDGKCRKPCYNPGETNCVCGEIYIENERQCNGNGGLICSNTDGTKQLEFDCACSPVMAGNLCTQGMFCYKQKCSVRGIAALYQECSDDLQCASESAKCIEKQCLPKCVNSVFKKCYCGAEIIEDNSQICTEDGPLPECIFGAANSAGCNCGGILCTEHCQSYDGMVRCISCDTHKFALHGFQCTRKTNAAGISIASICGVLLIAVVSYLLFVYIRRARSEDNSAAPEEPVYAEQANDEASTS